jgi:tetratricopeptide (TPR) repeat protein
VVAAAASPDHTDARRGWTVLLNHIRDGLSGDAVWLLHALAELPVRALTEDDIAAVLAGHDDAASVADPLGELRIRYLVVESNSRYRLPLEFRDAIAATTADEDRRGYARQAIPALLRHFAAEATDRAGRLGSDARDGDWFHDAERSLRPLFNESYQDDELLELVIDDLGRIAGALEGWYVREQQTGELFDVNDALCAWAQRCRRAELAAAAAIRMATAHRMAGRLGYAGAMLDAAKERVAGLHHAPELEVREQLERALLCLATADPDAGSLTVAKENLERVLATDPEHRNTTAVLINLGVLCLRLDQPDHALGHLRRAERLAIDRHDVSSRAHAIELRGVALSLKEGRLLDAVAAWRLAEHYFRTSGEEQGESRCLLHLGATALMDGRVAGRIRDNRPDPLDERAAAAVAVTLLERAERLRAGRPGTQLVAHYLSIARARLVP